MEPLTDLIIAISNPNKSTEYKRQQICAHTMKVIPHSNRISLWRFNEAMTQIDCLMCLSKKTNEYTSGTKLLKSDFGEYFDSILTKEVLVADDARNHQATSCFNESYLVPNDIHSMLDYILTKDGSPFGVICCESVGRKQEWQESDIQNLRRIANMSSMFF